MKGMVKELEKELREEMRRNLQDIIRQARWEAEMVRRRGQEWFLLRDKWLLEAHQATLEMMKDPRVREAVIRSILARDEAKRREREAHS